MLRSSHLPSLDKYLFGFLYSFGRNVVIVFWYEMSKKRWAIAGGVIFVLVSVGVGLFVFLHERRAKSSGRWREYFRSDG